MRNFAPQILASNTFDDPYKATFLQIEQSPAFLRVEGSATGVDGGSHRAVGVLQLKRSTTTIDASISVHSEMARAVCGNVPIGEDQDGRGGEFGEKFANKIFSWRACA